MLLGARQFFERRGAPAWQNPYVTDGLVAMWDGEWNAGGGVHDASATAWADLSGNGHDATFAGSYSIESDAIYFYNGGFALVDPGWAFGGEHTQEFAIKSIVNSGLGRIIGENRGLEVRNGARGFYGFGQDFDITSGAGFPSSPFSASVAIDVSLSIDNRFRYYENGVVLAQPPVYVVASAVTTALTLANRQAGGRAVTVKFHCVRLYSRRLTDSEIGHNCAIDKARFNLP